MFNTPILFIVFNRPEHTRRVLAQITEQKPSSLFIFQDGVRDNVSEDVENCAAVRSVIEESLNQTKIQAKCWFAESNLGCGRGPASAISWFLNEVEQGIIIEDDALPHPDFFVFAETLLNEYASDNSVMAIGSMKLGKKKYSDGSYYFSKMNHTLCAWATWRRAWAHFDLYLKDFSEKQLDTCLKLYGARLREREYWCERLKEIHKDCLSNSSWDQQFWMCIWRMGGKGILPNVNLCTNIGFDSLATHTYDSSSLAANVPSESILPLVHPSRDSINREADFDFQRSYFSPWSYGWKGVKNLPYRINKRLKKLLHHEGSWIKRG